MESFLGSALYGADQRYAKSNKGKLARDVAKVKALKPSQKSKRHCKRRIIPSLVCHWNHEG